MSTIGVQAGWNQAATWADGQVRREVLFFESGGEQLYGSLFAAESPTRPVGLVICSSWGIEAHRMGTLIAKLAHKAAQKGGAAFAFHYPGFGDSTGRSDSLTMEQLAIAAVDAVAQASSRQPGFAWGLAGVRLGASIAALAARRARSASLLLVQPALDPNAYFEDISAMARRASLGTSEAPDFAFGYPIPQPIGQSLAAKVSGELVHFDGNSAIAVHHESPPIDHRGLGRFERIIVPGTWQFGLKAYQELKDGALAGLRRVLGGDRA
jgi:alpha/beta superfamily hydrolase